MSEDRNEWAIPLVEALKDLRQGRKAALPELSAHGPSDPILKELQAAVFELTSQYNAGYDFLIDLSNGKLETSPPPLNSFLTPFKQLQSQLLYLTWQIRQISTGDLGQQVSFSGDFSESINRMIESLREKERISELNEQYLTELRELNASKDKLFSIIAHDLRNPFSGLLNLSEMLLEDLGEGQFRNAEEYARLLKAFSLQGYKLLTNLLDWARLQTETMLVRIVPVRLDEVLDEVLPLVEPFALQKEIRLEVGKPAEAWVMADSNMLQTVLRNLLSNAVKFSPAGSVVQLTIEKQGVRMRFCVCDHGVGIQKESFDKLFRVDSAFSTTGTAGENGSGLGLILCRDFLNRMGSGIQVVSEPGQGSEFSFRLPLADPQP